MVPFLKHVAINLYSRFGDNMQDVCIVFPNRRSILYYNKYLSQIVSKPIWAPKCYTISEFVQDLSKLRKADDLLLLFDLYKIYCNVRQSNEPFDSFYYWGELMLSDFDDIDKYLVNAEALFKNLSSLKNINEQFSYLSEEQIEAIKQFWGSYNQSKPSQEHKQFSHLWESLFAIYSTFKETVSKKNVAYEGMIYREVAESLDKSGLEASYKHIAFVGFNALNECEKSIFKYFKNNNNALFYWDYDIEYLNDKVHEAGFFIKQNIIDFPPSLDSTYFNNLSQQRNIELIAVPSNTGQTKVAGNLASQFIKSNKSLENTAILLTDETLLMPVLHSIPDEITDVNVTMGFPLKGTSIVSLIESLGKLLSQVKYDGETSTPKFYYKSLLEVLKHPYFSKNNTDEILKLEIEIINNNLINIPVSKIPKSNLTGIITNPPKTGIEYIRKISSLIKIIGYTLFSENNNENKGYSEIESDTLMQVYTTTNILADLISESDTPFDIKLCHRLLMKRINSLTMPFEGEPLKGLQIMGFLESRAIDFNNVIIIGVNEGNLPKTNVPISFIPYNLRHGFGLPTIEYRDAMYAYYFYRVLQRAENIYLLYNTVSAKTGNSEISRYATQLLYNSHYKIKQNTQTFNIVPSKLPVIIFHKTDEIKQTLQKYYRNDAKNFLSPSAINTFIDCKLKFYYKYVAGIKAFEKPAEEIDPSLLGNILHSAMHNIYSSYKENTLNNEELLNIIKENDLIEKILLNAMSKEYFKKSISADEIELQGRNFIIFNILKKYIKRILEYDSSIAPIHIIGLEHNIVHSFEINVNNELINVRIGGNIDRIDEVGSNIRIIDYKTGKVESKFTSFDELFSPSDLSKSKKEIFQALLYAIILNSDDKPKLPIKPVLYSLREIFNTDFKPEILFNKEPVINISEVQNEFIEKLKLLIIEIFHNDVPFEQTTDLQRCKYCDYKIICHR